MVTENYYFVRYLYNSDLLKEKKLIYLKSLDRTKHSHIKVAVLMRVSHVTNAAFYYGKILRCKSVAN